jgi:hypothetical protein
VSTWGAALLAWAKVIQELVAGAKALAAFVEANKNEKWFQDSTQVFQELKKAQTPEEMREVAKKLRDLWAGA